MGAANIGFETILEYLIYYLALFEMNWIVWILNYQNYPTGSAADLCSRHNCCTEPLTCRQIGWHLAPLFAQHPHHLQSKSSKYLARQQQFKCKCINEHQLMATIALHYSDAWPFGYWGVFWDPKLMCSGPKARFDIVCHVGLNKVHTASCLLWTGSSILRH